MSAERTKNTTRNIFWGTINKCLNLFIPFFIRTIIIKVLGSDYLGLSGLFTSILQVLNIAELGFSSAIVFSMYKPIVEHDTAMVCALLALYRRVYRIIGTLILSVGLCLLPFLKLLINGGYPADINIYILYIIYLSNTTLSYFIFAHKSCLLNAHQRNDIISNIYSIFSILQYCIQIVILLWLSNYYLYIASMPVFTIINSIYIAILAKRRFPHYVCKGKLNKAELSDIKKRVGGLVIQKICTVTRNSFDSIFVSAYIGLTAVAIYGNYYYVFSSVIGLLSVLTTAMNASVGNSIAVESAEKNYIDLKNFMFLYACISGWCFTCLLCLYQHFMLLWVGETLMFPNSVMVLFCIYFYSLTMGDIRSLYTTGAGLWWEGRYRSILESVTNFVLNWILVIVWGVYGIVIATIVSILVINFGYGSHIVFKYYFKNGKLKEYFVLQSMYFGVAMVVGALAYIICNALPDYGVLWFLLKAVVCSLVCGIFYIMVYYKTAQFQNAKTFCKQLTTRMKHNRA